MDPRSLQRISLLPLLLLILLSTKQACATTTITPEIPEILVLEASASGAAPVGDGVQAPVLRVAKDSALTAAIRKELDRPVGRLARKLDELARAVGNAANECPVPGDPVILYLSEEDGGYARKGFWFETHGQKPVFCDELYVDMTVSAQDIADGSFLEVFVHEMGHVYLRRLMGDLPVAPSSRFHNVFAVTDYQTAFDEGFGIYFQTLASVLSTHPGLQARMQGRNAPSLAEQWFSRIDGRFRIYGVMHNQFVFNMIPEHGNNAAEQFAQSGLSAIFGNQLKGAQSMLASEGVIATLFYRLATGPGLSALDPADSDWFADTVLHHKRLFEAMNNLSWGDQNLPLYIQLLRQLRSTDQEYAEAAVRDFIFTTYAQTVDKDMAALLQRLTDYGRMGQLQAFIPLYKEARESIEVVVKEVQSGDRSLVDNLGATIWLKHNQVMIPVAPWDQRHQPLCINLNMADETDLNMLSVFDTGEIKSILSERYKNGAYNSLESLQKRINLPRAKISVLQEMHEQHKHSGCIQRE